MLTYLSIIEICLVVKKICFFFIAFFSPPFPFVEFAFIHGDNGLHLASMALGYFYIWAGRNFFNPTIQSIGAIAFFYFRTLCIESAPYASTSLSLTSHLLLPCKCTKLFQSLTAFFLIFFGLGLIKIGYNLCTVKFRKRLYRYCNYVK